MLKCSDPLGLPFEHQRLDPHSYMLEITILNPNEHRQLSLDLLEVRIGSCATASKNHVVIADKLVSEFQCLIELVPSDSKPRIRITNLGGSMVLGTNLRMHHRITREEPLPCSLGVGDTIIQFTSSSDVGTFDHALQEMPTIGSSYEFESTKSVESDQSSPSPETLTSWFEALGRIQRSTAGENSYFQLAARTVFNPGGMDGCVILAKNNDDWQVIAQHIPNPTAGIFYRKDLIKQVAELGRPLFHDSQLMNASETYDPHAAVVCPVFNDQNEVTAIVYGFRYCNTGGIRRGIRSLEAKFVNLIADSVSAGMTRLNREADRARQRVLLEQAFSPEVVKQLETNPEILSGQEREVTVLFSDLRGFCKISESAAPSKTYQLLSDVLGRFTKIVHQHEGVIIDFYGDGMAAFWNAPVEQPNHPKLACQAGQAICEVMTELNETWATEIGHRLRVGVGIHTGIAQVGNSGCLNRLKYGPQGTTVNIASRLEQATKAIGVDMIISGETAARIDDGFVTQKICSVQLDGINQSIDATLLVKPIEFAKHGKQIQQYSDGLALFEADQYLEALDTFSAIADSEFSYMPLEFILNELKNRISQRQEQQTKPLAAPTSVICVGK